MSRTLAQLLGQDTPQFHVWLRGVEKAAGLPSADIRLALTISTAVRGKMKQLGLDVRDTTGAELYAALQARLLQDETRVQASLQCASSHDPEVLLRAIANFLQSHEQASKVIVLKPAVAKRILKKLKPRATMKLLGYRSLDSMLKHESVAELLAAADFAESQEWHTKRLAEYRKLEPSNFELKPVRFSVPTGKKWPAFAASYTEKHHHNILPVATMGTVVILPLHVRLPALGITTIALCVQALNDIRAASAFLKLHQVRPDFAEIFSNMVFGEWSQAANIRGKDVSWQTLHWFYGSVHNDSSHPELFEPHVQTEDMWLVEAEKLLLMLDPELEFWQNTHFLGILDGSQPVSMNILDVALSVCNARRYSARLTHHMKRTLHRELAGLYLSRPAVHAAATQDLEQRLVPDFSYE